MNTPTQQNRSSASDSGITPSATLSATALATACCAGPNICTACLAPLIVTLLNRIVEGLQARFGATNASSEVKPSLLFVNAFANTPPEEKRRLADGHVSVDRQNGYPCCQHPAGDAGPVSRIAAEARPARQSQSLLQADGKMFRSRFANSVATVRSALVPGLTERSCSDRSYASSSGSSAPGSRAAPSRSRKRAAARRTSSAVSAPRSRAVR